MSDAGKELVRRPEWSRPFSRGAVREVDAIAGIDGLTTDWASGGSTGAGVRVAVVDSGIDAAHPALSGGVQGYCAVTEAEGELAYGTAPHADEHGHGTACAAIIRDLAPECELYSVKVLGAGLSGSGGVFAGAIRWAIDNGIHVCNLSLGTTKPDFYRVLHELADLAYFRRVVLVTAANNLARPSFPSIYASVISVACNDADDGRTFHYNPEPPVEFGAPGINIRVAWKDGGWITATGNSFAAPHITGHVARIIGKHPDLAAFHVKAILRALAANVVPPEPRRGRPRVT